MSLDIPLRCPLSRAVSRTALRRNQLIGVRRFVARQQLRAIDASAVDRAVRPTRASDCREIATDTEPLCTSFFSAMNNRLRVFYRAQVRQRPV